MCQFFKLLGCIWWAGDEILVARIIRNSYRLAVPRANIFPLTPGSTVSHPAGLSSACCSWGLPSNSPVVLWPLAIYWPNAETRVQVQFITPPPWDRKQLNVNTHLWFIRCTLWSLKLNKRQVEIVQVDVASIPIYMLSWTTQKEVWVINKCIFIGCWCLYIETALLIIYMSWL